MANNITEPAQKEGQRLILNDGTVIEDGRCGYSDGHLWCWVKCTMAAAAAIFLNPERTEKIVYEYGEMSSEYDGFTVCVNIFTDSDENVSVCLVKGAS